MTETLGDELNEMAEHWDIPAFDPDVLVQRSRLRSRRRRRRRLGAAAVITVGVTGVLAAVLLTASGGGSVHKQNGTPQNSILRPAFPPPVRVTAIDPTHQRVGGILVLARTTGDHAVTVRAELVFVGHRPARVQDAALLIAKPGTNGGVSGPEVDSHFRGTEIARGSFVAANSPQTRVLTAVTPPDLPPGRYPVFYVFRSTLLPGQSPGTDGPFDVSGQLGVIVVLGK